MPFTGQLNPMKKGPKSCCYLLLTAEGRTPPNDTSARYSNSVAIPTPRSTRCLLFMLNKEASSRGSSKSSTQCLIEFVRLLLYRSYGHRGSINCYCYLTTAWARGCAANIRSISLALCFRQTKEFENRTLFKKLKRHC
jgi:hypothetical protein